MSDPRLSWTVTVTGATGSASERPSATISPTGLARESRRR